MRQGTSYMTWGDFSWQLQVHQHRLVLLALAGDEQLLHEPVHLLLLPRESVQLVLSIRPSSL